MRSVKLDPLRTRLSEVRSARTADQRDPRSLKSQAEVQIESRLRAELAAQARELYESAHARGLADGRAAAITQAEKGASEELRRTIDTLTEHVQGALSAMERAHQAALLKLQASSGEVAFAAVCRLVGGQGVLQPFVLGVVERTCAELRGELNATARLHPRDIEILRELLQGQELKMNSLGLSVVADESLELGGCVIEAASGHYDGGLERQLRRLHAILAGASGPASKDQAR